MFEVFNALGIAIEFLLNTLSIILARIWKMIYNKTVREWKQTEVTLLCLSYQWYFEIETYSFQLKCLLHSPDDFLLNLRLPKFYYKCIQLTKKVFATSSFYIIKCKTVRCIVFPSNTRLNENMIRNTLNIFNGMNSFKHYYNQTIILILQYNSRALTNLH